MSTEIGIPEGETPFTEEVKQPEVIVKQENKQVQVKTEIALDENGRPIPKTLEESFRVSSSMFNSKVLPKWVDGPMKALVAFQYCKELGLPPLVTINNMCMINGQINIWGELPLALVRRSGKLKYFNEFIVDDKYQEINFENKNLDKETFAAVCVVQRDDGERKSYSFSQKDAATANQGLKAVWVGYKNIMMKRKARALALKDQFGDVLLGTTIAEYTHEVLPDYQQIDEPKPSTADRLNKLYAEEKKESEAAQTC